MSNELDMIIGIADSVSVGGMEVKVSPHKVRDIPAFSRALKSQTIKRMLVWFLVKSALCGYFVIQVSS